MRVNLWLAAGLMSATLFMIAGCGGGNGGGGSSETDTAAPSDNPTPGPGAVGIGPPPHVFVGAVSVAGSPAPDGTLVTAFIQGKSGPVAQAEVSGGTYTLMVEQTSGADFGGKAVTFTVSDQETSPSVPWEFGGANEVNLSVSTISGSGGGSGSGTGGGTGGGSGSGTGGGTGGGSGSGTGGGTGGGGGSGTGGGTGGGGSSLVSQGKDIFTGGGGCAACHTIEGISAGLVGPDLSRLGTEGSGRKPGLSAKEYITESIRDPEAFVAEGVERSIPGIMTGGITAGLSDAEVDALVAFLLEQK